MEDNLETKINALEEKIRKHNFTIKMQTIALFLSLLINIFTLIKFNRMISLIHQIIQQFQH